MARSFPLRDRIRHELARFRVAMGGNVALIFALALPPLAVATVGGIQLSYVMTVRSTSQDVADAAALAGAQQMSLSPVGAADRAKSWAQTQLASKSSSSTFTVAANLIDDHTLQVTVDAYTPSFFGDLLPKGGFKSHAEATAQQQALAPLCVLVDGASSDYLKLTGQSQLSGACLVHANGDIQVDPAAAITATRVETSGTASGAPNALSAAPTVADPFASLAIPYAGNTCSTGGNGTPITIGNSATTTIPAGFHDGDVTIGNTSNITLGAGDHYFCRKFTIGNNTTVTGQDVSLIFDGNPQSRYDPKSTPTLSLSGRESGTLSGFVWVMARNRTADFVMQTDQIAKITGAVYSPNARLVLNGSKQAAQASDWTVVAAKSLRIDGAANLQINTNYAGSTVHVPIGVGDKASSGSPIRLVK